MIILALDAGKFNTMCCLFNSKTRKHEFINTATKRIYLTTLLKRANAISSSWKRAARGGIPRFSGEVQWGHSIFSSG